LLELLNQYTMLNQRWHKYIRLFLMLTLTAMFIKGCSSFSPQKTLPSKAKSIGTECRIVKHELGESCIPLHPQRIIVMDQESLEALVALGLQPIATTTSNLVGNKTRILPGKIDNIIDLGKESLPNLEKIVQLHPDLIFGFFITPKNYQLFSQIAPTVSMSFTETGWKNTLRQISEVVGKSKEAEILLSQYQQKVEKFKVALSQKLGKKEISVMRFYTDIKYTQFLNELSFPVSIMQELNLSIPLVQQQVSNIPGVSYENVSLERVDLLEADAMFIALDPGAEENFQKYQNSPLWQTLNVVKNKRVYTVDSGYWVFGSILSANAVLDDIFKYLIETP
jgi:iron complex transport system substrate-binding protein